MYRDENRQTSFLRPSGNGRTTTSQARARSAVAESAFPAGKDTPSSKIAYLAAMSLFRDLSPQEMEMVDQSAFTTTAPKGKIVYRPDETGEVLYLLMKGSVHLYQLSPEGRKLIVQIVGPMTFFGEMPLVGRRMHNLFAEAVEDCTICAMGRADVERLMLSNPHVVLRMLEEVGQRMLDIQERLSESVFKGVPARLASSLLKVSNNGECPAKGLTHQDLADMLGTYRETVTSALGRLRDEGIIKLSRKKIAILKPEQLRQVAEDEVLRQRYPDVRHGLRLAQKTSLEKGRIVGGRQCNAYTNRRTTRCA